MESDIGVQHAFDRMLSVAYEDGASGVRRIAREFTPETREQCVGMALAEIDNCFDKGIEDWPYQIMVKVLDEIKAEH